MIDSRHPFLDEVIHLLGHQLGPSVPMWLHPVMHVVLVWAPLALAAVGLYFLAKALWNNARARTRLLPSKRTHKQGEAGIYGFVLSYSARQQAILIVAGLLSLPILYATLELPKLIINNALSEARPESLIDRLGFTETTLLFVLSGLYLLAIAANGLAKYWLNVRKGRVGERLLRRLRLTIFRHWQRRSHGERDTEVIPLITQEIEPIGGFAADAFAVPVFQGGTLATILFFMFLQDPILGAAALTLLPVQLALIPKIQQRVNALTRTRVSGTRAFGRELGAVLQDNGAPHSSGLGSPIRKRIRFLEEVRERIYRWKFFQKALNNFLTSLTPFFFYSIGGYLVLEGRLTIGALVAALAAYKDISAPLRELFQYYQVREDVKIRYTALQDFIHGARRQTGYEELVGLGSMERRTA
ncbi:ABC transporter ATP-binding protein [Nisaea sp.]|uniref:ABC transporter ATP-binding protein n=1 Tax=Nisaea sp. TaxID=2024842 RepID=UPI003B51DEEC